MGGKRWTHIEKITLESKIRSGDSYGEIADAMSRTYQMIKKAASRWGYRGRYKSRLDIVQRALVLDDLVAYPGDTLWKVACRLHRNPKSMGSIAKYLVRDGFLERCGGNTISARFLVTRKWFPNQKAYHAYLEEVEKRIPQVYRVSREVPNHPKDAAQGVL